MKTKLQMHLAAIAPSISIETIWSHDDSESFADPINKDWTKGEDEDDWQCWQSEIRASVIVNGEVVTGSAYMGGTWEKYGDDPHVSNPEISGYEDQMTVEALEELIGKAHEWRAPVKAAMAAIAECKRLAREAYETQQATLA
jgi:hypothetical protein